jgi:hypothetical protein
MDNKVLTVVAAGFAIGMVGCVDEPFPEHPGIDTREQQTINTSEHPEYPDINALPAPASDLSPVRVESPLASVPVGAIISPVSATIDAGGPGFGSINDTVNQRGLTSTFTSGVTNFDTYLATTPLHTDIFAGFEWFSNAGTTGATVTYDLGAVITIDRLALWNEESSGIGTLSLLSSKDGVTFTPLVSGLHPTDNPLADYPADVFAFTPTGARFVRLVASDSPQPDPGSFPAAAIGEVAFRVGSGNFTIAGSVPLPQPNNDPDGEFASGSAQNAAQCNPHRANAYRRLGQAAALSFSGLGATDASDLLNHFLAGVGTPIDYPDGSTLSQAVKADSQFIALDKAVQAAAAAQFNTGLAAAEVTPDLKLLNFSTLSTARSLQLAFGGTQGLDVQGTIHIENGNYTGTITYKIEDIYGFFDNNKFLFVGKAMHYLQGICGAPDFPDGAHWFADSVTVTVPFNQPAP